MAKCTAPLKELRRKRRRREIPGENYIPIQRTVVRPPARARSPVALCLTFFSQLFVPAAEAPTRKPKEQILRAAISIGRNTDRFTGDHIWAHNILFRLTTNRRGLKPRKKVTSYCCTCSARSSFPSGHSLGSWRHAHDQIGGNSENQGRYYAANHSVEPARFIKPPG